MIGRSESAPNCFIGDTVSLSELTEALGLAVFDQFSPKLRRQFMMPFGRRQSVDWVNVGANVGM